MSFYCDHCGFKNTEIQSAGEIQEHGIRYTLKMDHLDDMERQIVKSDTAVFRIENLDIEIPAGRGKLTNVEGVLSEVLTDLEAGQGKRKKEESNLFEKIDVIVQLLTGMISGINYPFAISLDDPAGNSWIEPSSEDSSHKYTRTEYPRSSEQNAALGLGGEQQMEQKVEVQNGVPIPLAVPQVQPDESGGMEDVDILEGTTYSLPCACPGCGKSASMNLQMVNIPYFKQVVVSAVVCPACGYKTSDVKTGGEIPEKGQRIWLDVRDPVDLRRDILKSETCMLRIPACKVEVVPGTMGGRFTTVEGLLTQIRDDLRGSIFDIGDAERSGGDSMPDEKKKGWDTFFSQLDKAIKGEIQYTVIMEDPLASSYIQSLNAPDPDPKIRTEDYERTAEEEEDLGLADMRTQRGNNGDYVRELMATGADRKHASEDSAHTQAERERRVNEAHQEILSHQPETDPGKEM